jgi:YfiH family protein
MKSNTIGSLQYFTFDIFDQHKSVTCVITTRIGGTSSGPFASLNLGARSGDDPSAVRDNRAQLSMLTNGFPDLLTFGRQVHGSDVAVVTGSTIGSGATDADSALPDTDAMVTDMPDVPLVVLVADCCSVSLYDPAKNAVGVAHAGWRGTVAGIAAAAVNKMVDQFQSRPEDLLVGIGPSIGRCCYEVGSEVCDRFSVSFPDLADRVFDRPGDRNARFDLQEANRLILSSVGVDDDRIEVAGLCTSCRTDLFYSHRAEDGNTGRFGALIMLHDRTHRVY